MATTSKQGTAKRRSSGAKRTGGSGAKRASSNGRVTAAQVARHAIEQMRELMTQPVEGVRGVRRGDDGGWEVTLEVLELERIPNSTDVLGSYLLMLDDKGEVTEWRRVRRYHRNQVEEG